MNAVITSSSHHSAVGCCMELELEEEEEVGEVKE